MKALVVDDNFINREVISEALSAAGCDVESADGGREAIARLGEHAFDVVFLDLNMPDVDGTAVYGELRKSKNNTNTKVFLVTAADESAAQAAAEAMELEGIIYKPIELDAVVDAVDRCR